MSPVHKFSGLAALRFGLASLLMISPVAASPDQVGATFGSRVVGMPATVLDGRVYGMTFTGGGTGIVAVTTNAVQQIEWPGTQVRPLWQPTVNENLPRPVFSPDGSLFVDLSSDTGGWLCIHETATRKLSQRFGGRAPGSAAAWSPDGEMIAFGGKGEILIHRVKDGGLHKRLPQDTTALRALALSRDGKWLALASQNEGATKGSVLLTSLEDDPPPVKLPGNLHTKFSFTPDSRILAVYTTQITGNGTSVDGIYFWDLTGGRAIFGRRGSYSFLAHSADGKWLAVGGNNHLEVHDAQTGAEIFRHGDEFINSSIGSAAFSPDGKVLAYGVEDRVKFRETETWTEIQPDEDLRAPVSALAFSPDGKHLATGGLNGDLLLWDWDKKVPLWKHRAAPGTWGIQALSIDPQARWIGAVQPPLHPETSPLSLLDYATGENRRYLSGAGATEAPPLFRKKTNNAYLAGKRQSLVEWDCESNQLVRNISLPSLQRSIPPSHAQITGLEFDPTEPRCIRWNAENYFGRIDPESATESLCFETSDGRPDADLAPARTHDFIHRGADVWNVPSFKPATRGSGSNAPVARSPFGLLLFSGHGSTVRVFDLLSLSEIQEIHLASGEIKALAVSPDGRTLVAGTSGGLRYVSLPVDRWPEPFVLSRSGQLPPIEGGVLTDDLPQSRNPPPGEDDLWQIMGSNKEWDAYQAAWELARRPDFVRFIETRLPQAGEVTEDVKHMLGTMLKDGNHAVRQTAARRWLDLGLTLDKKIYETLREGVVPDTFPHYDSSANAGLDPREPIPLLTPLSEHKRAMRAVMILQTDRGDASKRCLEKLAAGADSAPLTQAAKRALLARAG
jgi:WD40 repeat protein